MFDTRYNSIPIKEAYGLVQSLLASEPFTSAPIGASALVGVVNPLQFSIPVDSKTLWINPVSNLPGNGFRGSWINKPERYSFLCYPSQ